MIEKRPVTKNLLHIDPKRLDEAVLNHAELYFEFAGRLAAERERVSAAKNALELIEAEITAKVHRDPTVYGIEKPTVATVKSVVLTAKRYKAADEALQEINKDLAVLQAFVAALDHRKSMLGHAVALHLSNYHSTPRMKGESKEFVSDARKKDVRRMDSDD